MCAARYLGMSVTWRDWDEFVQLTRRLGVDRIIGYRGVVEAVWLNGVNIRFDMEERRAYFSIFDGSKRVRGPEWLDDDIFVWLDVLRRYANAPES